MSLLGARSRTVPECYIGLWQRRLLRDAHGEDTSTQVFWLQTGALFADVRIPADRNSAGGSARQQGFAGVLEAQDNLLTWRRWLDFQPPSASEDMGRVRFTAPDVMIEDGVHADYEEVWERIGPASHDRAAFALQVEHMADGSSRRRAGVFVLVGEHFMFALDRLIALPAAPSLAELADLAARGQIEGRVREQLFACEISLGRRNAAGGCEILHSTLPAREGAQLFAVHGALLQADKDRFEQRLPDGGWRIWRQIERGARLTGW